jgi:hypothetical protein
MISVVVSQTRWLSTGAIRPHLEDKDSGRVVDKSVQFSERITSSVCAWRKDKGLQFADRLACTVDDACSAIGLGRTKLYQLIGEGSVETTSIGRRRLVLVRSLVALIDEGCHAAVRYEKGGSDTE